MKTQHVNLWGPRSASYWLTAIVAVGIVILGTRFIMAPIAGAEGFGISLPPTKEAMAYGRIKGIRDIFSGIVVFGFLIQRQPRATAFSFGAAVIIPVSDCLNVLAVNGVQDVTHLLIHGLTSVYMIITTILLFQAGPKVKIMNTVLMQISNGAAIIATAVVFGTDVFFARVGKKAAAKSKDSSIADLTAHFHEVADARMPIIGITAIVTTLIQIILAGLKTMHGQLASVALAALLVHLAIYFTVSKPVNNIMVEGVKFGRIVDNIRQLQQRWDKVIVLRAVLLLLAMMGLILINYVKQ